MGATFEDLMTGLNEVDAFLGGETAGHKVALPAEVDMEIARNPNAVMEALRPGVEKSEK